MGLKKPNQTTGIKNPYTEYSKNDWSDLIFPAALMKAIYLPEKSPGTKICFV